MLEHVAIDQPATSSLVSLFADLAAALASIRTLEVLEEITDDLQYLWVLG